MRCPVRIAGVGVFRAPGTGREAAEERARRLQSISRALVQDRSPVRLSHAIEETAILAAYDALRHAGLRMPYQGEDIGVTLGVEEGLDGIKARYYAGVLRDGPLGASLIAFPLTTPNTIAARISILFDLRGESLTVGGGGLSGAHAIGLAVRAVRDGRSAMVLAGGVTSIEEEFLDALAHFAPSTDRPCESAAALLLLGPHIGEGGADNRGLLGFGEGFGARDVGDAIQACLEDASTSPRAIGSVRVATMYEWRSMVDSVRQAGLVAPIVHSASSNLESASFPLAVVEASEGGRTSSSSPVLVLGRDCLAGAAAAVVRGEE